MKTLILAALLSAAIIPATVFGVGPYESGNSLLAKCENKKSTDLDYGLCLGYIRGIVDVHNTFVAGGLILPRYCLAKGVTTGQLQKIVVKFMEERPELLHQSAGIFVIAAFSSAFPISYKDDGDSSCQE